MSPLTSVTDLPRVLVPRAVPDPGNPFVFPPASRLSLRDSTTGVNPVLATTVGLYHDGSVLYIVFVAKDDEVCATLTEHDADLYTEDVVEIFLAPRSLSTYFEIEVNPLGTTFDARVESPHGDRRSMTVDRGWECEGLQVMTDRVAGSDGGSIWRSLITLPFASLRESTSESMLEWRANFFRIDRSGRGRECSAWSPTMRDPADFHVPAMFGVLLLE